VYTASIQTHTTILPTAAAGHVWEGSQKIVRPRDELSSFRSPAEETFNATDIPVRSSVTTISADTKTKKYLGPESLPGFEEWVLQQPLGRQVYLSRVAYTWVMSRVNSPRQICQSFHKRTRAEL